MTLLFVRVANQPDGERVLLQFLAASGLFALASCLALSLIHHIADRPLRLGRVILDTFYWMGVAIVANIALFALIAAAAVVRNMMPGAP